MLTVEQYFERLKKALSKFPPQVGRLGVELVNWIIRFERETPTSDFKHISIFARVPIENLDENAKMALMAEFDELGKPQLQHAFDEGKILARLPNINDDPEKDNTSIILS